MSEKYWLAAYVKMHHEKKTRDKLTAMGIENFLPVQTEVHQWSDRKKKVERVLIPMMIFVYVNRAEQTEVLTLSSVTRYVVLRNENQPARIPEKQMESFRFMLDFSDAAVNFSNETFNVGEKVKVIKGPLKGLMGELINVNGKSGIAVRIEQLGFATVEIAVGMIEKIVSRK